ncbi:MAG TPA: transglutaminase-like domain-containing protein, partial [Vicinamibacteria bacterium]|nr:transglutaminase-like domain-containing protein [Vicinamibacteria bacterium]
MNLRDRGRALGLAGLLLAVWPVVASPAERPFEEAARTLSAMANGEVDGAALRRLLVELQKRDAAQQRQFAAAAGKRLPASAGERLQAAQAAYAAGQGRLLAIVIELVRDLEAQKDLRSSALLPEAQDLVRKLEAASRRAPISAGELKVKAPALVTPALAAGATATASSPDDTTIGPVPAILKQAAATLAGPVDVYEWVRNTIRPELYHGAMKGAERTYAEGSGNDADTAALLIQMLRAKGIPARFARGTVEMPGTTLQAIVGTASVEQAVRALDRAAIPHETVMRSSGIASVKLERVWAEAYVPYANYRGAVMDQHGKAWVPLDAGFKRLSPPRVVDPQRDLTLDVRSLVGDYLLDGQGGQPGTPREVVRDRIVQRLAEAGSGLSYEEFLNRRDLFAENLGLLPSTLPYRPTGAPEVSYEIQDSLRHTVHFKVETADRTVLDATLPVADLLGRRLTLSYVPFAPEDEDLARQFGGLLKTPPYLAQVKPILKSGGVDLVAGTGPVGLGVKVAFTLEFHTPGGTQIVTNDVVAGNLTAVGLGGRGVVRQEELGGKAAQVLSSLAQAYLESWDRSDDELAAIFKVVPVRPTVSACFVMSEIDVDYAGGDPLYPVRYEFKGIAVDADLRASAPVGIVDRSAEKSFTLVSALEGSVLEHRVFENTLGISSVSTARALALAVDAGIAVNDLTSANVETVLPGLPIAESAKAEIRDATSRGFLARVPAAPVSYLAWTGIGYVLIDEETGEAAYQLQGGHSGGVTAPSVIELPQEIVDPLETGDEDVEAAPEDAAVAHVEKFVSTDFQEGTVDKALKKSLKVLVTDADGFPVRNAFVTFTAIGGGGRLTDPAIGGLGEPEVVVRSNDRGEAVASLTLGKRTDLIPRFVDIGGEFKEQVGLNLVAVRSGLATLPEPFTAVAYPDYRWQPDGRILVDVKWKGQETSCFACGWPNLRVSALMALDLTDPFGNPISDVEVHFVYRPDPVPNDPPAGWVRMRPATTTPGRILKVSDYLGCLATTANPIWGECTGEASSQVVMSSPNGAYAYAALGDSPFSYYYFDIKNDRDESFGFTAYPTNGFNCHGPDPSACGGDAPADPIVSMGQRTRVTNRLGNQVEAYPPSTA